MKSCNGCNKLTEKLNKTNKALDYLIKQSYRLTEAENKYLQTLLKGIPEIEDEDI